MFDFKPQAGADAAIVWEDLFSAVDGVTKGEPDPIANMANVAALLWELVPDLNWAGFYRMVGGELVLGPFQGRAACIRSAAKQNPMVLAAHAVGIAAFSQIRALQHACRPLATPLTPA